MHKTRSDPRHGFGLAAACEKAGPEATAPSMRENDNCGGPFYDAEVCGREETHTAEGLPFSLQEDALGPSSRNSGADCAEETIEQDTEEYESEEDIRPEEQGYALTIHNAVYPEADGAILLHPTRESVEETLGESATVLEWGEAVPHRGELGTLEEGEDGGEGDEGEDVRAPDVGADFIRGAHSPRNGYGVQGGHFPGAGGRSYLRVRLGGRGGTLTARAEEHAGFCVEDHPTRETVGQESSDTYDQFRISGVAEKR